MNNSLLPIIFLNKKLSNATEKFIENPNGR